MLVHTTGKVEKRRYERIRSFKNNLTRKFKIYQETKNDNFIGLAIINFFNASFEAQNYTVTKFLSIKKVKDAGS